MYHQVRVDPKDWDALMFLWWPNDDYTLPPADYQMMVHLFGAKSSPACASYAMRKVAYDNGTHASQETLETVRDSSYVDDCLKSVDNVDVAIRTTGFVVEEWWFSLVKICKQLSLSAERNKGQLEAKARYASWYLIHGKPDIRSVRFSATPRFTCKTTHAATLRNKLGMG